MRFVVWEPFQKRLQGWIYKFFTLTRHITFTKLWPIPRETPLQMTTTLANSNIPSLHRLEAVEIRCQNVWGRGHSGRVDSDHPAWQYHRGGANDCYNHGSYCYTAAIPVLTSHSRRWGRSFRVWSGAPNTLVHWWCVRGSKKEIIKTYTWWLKTLIKWFFFVTFAPFLLLTVLVEVSEYLCNIHHDSKTSRGS